MAKALRLRTPSVPACAHGRPGSRSARISTITGLRERPSGVDVSFERAPSRTFSLVIGADGLHSNVRALAFGEHDRFLEGTPRLPQRMAAGLRRHRPVGRSR